ncbi:MAG TPA: trypsin-like peptidase domain-containing protein [Polyangia bacterium]
MSRRRSSGAWALAAVVAAAAAGGCRLKTDSGSPGPAPVPALATPAPAAAAPASRPVKIIYPAAPGSFVDLAKKVVPAVVNIRTTQAVRGGPWEFWYGEPMNGGRRPQPGRSSLGTGFVIDDDGHVLTNNHVIANADVIMVQTNDKREFRARLVGRDDKTDVALLKIDRPGVVPVRLGDSDQAEVGEWVLAVGEPFGLSHTVTAGIISAKGRDDDELQGFGREGYWNFIQTDASINPGNSGGPLVNMAGEVIGMNTAIRAQATGIGFAVPVNMIKDILPYLKREGRVARSWLGVMIQEITPQLKDQLRLTRDNGVLITEVIEQGPAERAGVKPGDIVTEFNGKPITSRRELRWQASIAGVGREVPMRIVRAGRDYVVSLRTEELPAAAP